MKIGDTGHAGHADARNFDDDCIASFSDSDDNDNAKEGKLTLI